MSKTQSISDVFEELLKGIEQPQSESDARFRRMIYPHFEVRVGVIQKRSPRHPFFEFMLDLGREDIERAFNRQPFRKSVLAFVLPERWMSVQEITGFMQALHTHPDAEAGKIKRIDLLTSSPVILTDFPADMMRIITFPDDPPSRNVDSGL